MQPKHPNIYHIVHIDKLQSIVDDGFLWCDEEVIRRGASGTTIGMSTIKQRRLEELTLSSHPDLYVGQCVPFYFCPRSVMLYMIYCGNSPDLTYRGGQENIIHLAADFYKTVKWAETNERKWAFTFSNAGSRYFEDSNDLARLSELDWATINSTHWSGARDRKQAEFLCEYSFPWELIEVIGVKSQSTFEKVKDIIEACSYKPAVEIKRDWYY